MQCGAVPYCDNNSQQVAYSSVKSLYEDLRSNFLGGWGVVGCATERVIILNPKTSYRLLTKIPFAQILI